MRTVGKRLSPGRGPDRQSMCDYCGAQWFRTQLRRDASQLLACPTCAPGLDVVSLSEGNARMMRAQGPRSVGPADGNYDRFTSPPSPGFVDPNGPPAPPVPGTPVWGPVTGRTIVPNATLAGGSYNWQKWCICLCGEGRSLDSISIAVTNWSGTGESGTGALMTANMQVEYPLGNFQRRTYNGDVLGGANSGETLWTDRTPLTTSIPHGSLFRIHGRQECAAGVPFCNSLFPYIPGGDALTASALDLTGQTITDTLTGIMFPAAVIGLTTLPTYGIVGDSIGAGANDQDVDPFGHRGVIARSLGALGLGRAYVNVSIPGETAANFVANSTKRRALLAAANPTSTICELSTNDLFVLSRTAASIEADLNAIRAFSELSGKPFLQTTCLPSTAGSWGSLGSQALRANEPQRVLLNNWIRNGGFSAATGYIETSDAFDFSRTGLIQVPGFPMTTDGTHMTTQAYKRLLFVVP